MRALLLRLLLLAGIGVNIAFLLINLNPERPHLGSRRRARILLRAGPARAQWVKENLLSEFSAAHDVDFELISAKDFTEVAATLAAERDKPTGIMLADIDDETADDLRGQKSLRPMEEVAPPGALAAAMTEYVPEAVERCKVEGKFWFLPKRALLDVAIYLRPAVEDAYLHWQRDRPAISAALKEANGVGLPASYDLEKIPDAWDMYDLFVVGWYWAHHPAAWASEPGPLPRLAFRTGHNGEALNDLFASFFAHGWTEQELAKTESTAVLDGLQWQALFRKHHLLVKEAEAPKGLDPFGVNAMFKARKLAWAPIDQADSLWVHGGSRRDAEPGMTGATDIDWATLPAGSSLELKSGEPARPGRSFSMEEVHLWAVPIHSPHPQLAFELAHYLTQRGLHQRETEAEGMLPIRADIAEEYPILFRLDWMQRMLDASYRQTQRGVGDMPGETFTGDYDELYLALREHVLTRTPVPVTLAAMRAAVRSFQPPKKEEEGAHAK